ncbi:hypothetical protein KAU85_02845 [Candidatus Bathyarchaeota archaeon]|nr:hypothetical protein [Candidatus Bathyarchaeota archaeon]
MVEYECFCIYGFRTVYPITWKVGLDPKSERSEGNVTIKSPEKANIVVSWGLLEKAKKRYSSLEKHARDSIDKIKKESKIKKVELVQTKHIQINSHKAIFSHIRIIFSMPKLLPFGKVKTYEQEVHSLHFYCEPSKRYFVVYGVTTSDKSVQQGRIFENIIQSFICHKAKASPTNK